MSEIDSSVANDGLDPRNATDHALPSTATRASVLLAAADIWSTNTVAVVPAETSAPVESLAKTEAPEKAAPARALRPSERLALAKSACSSERPAAEPKPNTTTDAKADTKDAKPAPATGVVQPRAWPPRRLSLALQGGGAFAAFSWGVLDRLLQEPDLSFDAISGASAGAVNAVLLACGLAEGGREHARGLLARFWNRTVNDATFRSLLLIGGLSPASTSVSFNPALRLRPLDPLDLNLLRHALLRDIDFAALRGGACPKLLIAATRVRDGRPEIFRNTEITADVVLASTCPPLVHGAVEVEDEAYWDGGYVANPPLVRLVQESGSADLLLVQATPSRDSTVPITSAAIDRRLDQITANAALNAEIAAVEWARDISLHNLRLHRIAAEDEIEELAQRNQADLGQSFVTLLRERGHAAADRWLQQGTERTAPGAPEPWDYVAAALQSFTAAAAPVSRL